ncbi:MAG: biotin transporter BioY [Clostridia bacterium]|nr:biotin transporter BioY [Clostridia bacterium]
MHSSVQKVARISLCAALLVLSAWATVPAAIPFTLQTLAVALTAGLLGGAQGSAALAVYLALGAVGLPVFSGMRGGLAVLLGPTGGYLFGFFLFILLGAYLLPRFRFKFGDYLALWCGLLSCYLFGTLWFACLYGGGKSFFEIAMLCVIPYLPFDAVKLLLAVWLLRRLRPLLRKEGEQK